MEKKMMLWKTKGMNRDLSVSAFNPEFAFENRNLRLSTNDSNTLLSWVNERGTSKITLLVKGSETLTSIEGTPIGTAVINDQLILFTTNSEGNDHIYKLSYRNSAKTDMDVTELYSGNLNFHVNYPLETIVSYESGKVQKVYWVDGRNQPRLINIANTYENDNGSAYDSRFDFIPELELNEKVTITKILGGNGMFAPGVIQYAFTYYNMYGQETNIFYTSPLLYTSHKDRGGSPEDKVDNAFRIKVEGLDTKFDYLRIYSIQRTSINATPICKRIQDICLDSIRKTYYPAPYAVSVGEPTVLRNGAYVPTISSFDALRRKNVNGITASSTVSWRCYTTKDTVIRMYSTTEEGYTDYTFGPDATESSALCVSSVPVSYGTAVLNLYMLVETTTLDGSVMETISKITEAPSVSYTDTGLSGDAVDPTELLYKGGETLIAGTLEQKEGTLFFGNLTVNKESSFTISNTISGYVDLHPDRLREIYLTKSFDKDYNYSSQLTAYKDSDNTQSVPCAGFKRGDYYRCGVQFQDKTGRWSEPAWVDDIQITSHPEAEVGIVKLPTIEGLLNKTACDNLITQGYRKVRPVVVYPNIQDRITVCQGIINPTLYTTKHRYIDKDLYAQSSWFFRPKINVSDIKDLVNWINDKGTVAPTPIGDNHGLIDKSPYLQYTNPNMKTIRYGVDDTAELNYGIDEETGDIAGEVVTYIPDNLRSVEIQGAFRKENKMRIDDTTVTMHSPDLEFDTQLSVLDYSPFELRQVGKTRFSRTLSDISIQTETPTASSNGSGFTHKSFSDNKMFGIVSGLFYDDYIINDDNETGDTSQREVGAYEEEKCSCKWMVYLWNKTGSLNNDINRPANKGVATAKLKKKVVSNLRYADVSEYWDGVEDASRSFTNYPQLFSSDQATMIKLGENIYCGNIDTVLNPDYSEGMYYNFNSRYAEDSNVINYFIKSGELWWKTYYDQLKLENGQYKTSKEAALWYYDAETGKWTNKHKEFFSTYIDCGVKKDLVRMKYKSTPHLVFTLNTLNVEDIDWNEDNHLDKDGNSVTYPTLPIIEVKRDRPNTIFGGISEDAFRENIWIPCGEPVRLDDVGDGNAVHFYYEWGDTYYQRYDCLKTYAFTPEDENQVVEIGSFMLETHVNIDGRYDRNRGQLSNINMSPRNFNLINPVYSQLNNFFSYKILPKEYYENKRFPNQITWSKTKESGADVDLWTNVTLASVLEMDGDKGEVRKLTRLKDQLLCFQDSGIGQVLYNENVQIQATQGVPVEIANSGKVQGKRYLNDTIGCSNKWSMATTPYGIYFMDSNEKSIYMFNGQVNNVSTAGGMNAWCKEHIPSGTLLWNTVFPVDSNGDSAFRSFYDRQNQDVLFTSMFHSFAFSERVNAFTSFYDYERTPFFCNLEDTGIWIKENGVLWKHQGGDYCSFFGENKPYSMILVGNPEPQADKTFTNLEFRACVDGDGEYDENTGRFTPTLPFDSLTTWNEYQIGAARLSNMRGHQQFQHHRFNDLDSSLKRKFRIWRCDIPRDNADSINVFDSSFNNTFHVSRKKHPMDRMRNPWIYLKLIKEAAPSDKSLDKVEIHDMSMVYFK